MRGTKTTDQMEKPFQGLIVEISPPSANFRVPAPLQRVAEDDHQHFRGSSSSSQFADRSYARQFADSFEVVSKVKKIFGAWPLLQKLYITRGYCIAKNFPLNWKQLKAIQPVLRRPVPQLTCNSTTLVANPGCVMANCGSKDFLSETTDIISTTHNLGSLVFTYDYKFVTYHKSIFRSDKF